MCKLRRCLCRSIPICQAFRHVCRLSPDMVVACVFGCATLLCNHGRSGQIVSPIVTWREKVFNWSACFPAHRLLSDCVWRLLKTQRHRLQKVINHCARIVFCSKKYEHVTPLLKQLNWPTLDDYRTGCSHDVQDHSWPESVRGFEGAGRLPKRRICQRHTRVGGRTTPAPARS